MKPLAFRRSLQEVPKGPEPPKDRRRKAAVWAAAKVGFSRLSVFVSPEPIAFRRWTFRAEFSLSILLAAWANRGCKESLPPEQAARLPNRVAAEERKAPLAREFAIARETLYQYMQTVNWAVQ